MTIETTKTNISLSSQNNNIEKNDKRNMKENINPGTE